MAVGGVAVVVAPLLRRSFGGRAVLGAVIVAGGVMIVTAAFIAAVADDELVGAGGEGVNTGPLEGVGGLHEVGVELGRAGEVEAADVEHVLEINGGVLGAVELGGAVHLVDTGFEDIEVGGGDEVGLVEDDDVGETDLFFDLGGRVDVEEDVFGVHDGDDAIEAEGGLHLVVGEKSLGDRAGVGEPGGLDEDAVEAILALHEAAEDADEVAADGAADAAVVHFEKLLVGLDDELVVYADLAELVFDDGEFFAMLLGEDAVEKGGLAGAEEAGEDGDGDGCGSDGFGGGSGSGGGHG